MPQAPRPKRPVRTDSSPEPWTRRDNLALARDIALVRDGARHVNGGFTLLPFVEERTPSQPATDATWSWSVRRLARTAIWLLPAFGTWYALLTLVSRDSTPAAYLAKGQPVGLVAWIIAMGLGLLAVLALTGLLIATRARRMAVTALVVLLSGTLLMLPTSGVPGDADTYGTTVRVLVWTGAVIYSLGWLLIGLAVIRSGVLGSLDGILLIVAAPMLGVGGVYTDPLRTLGAVLVLTASIGLVSRAGQLVPPVGPPVLRPGSAPGAVAAAVPPAGGSAP